MKTKHVGILWIIIIYIIFLISAIICAYFLSELSDQIYLILFSISMTLLIQNGGLFVHKAYLSKKPIMKIYLNPLKDGLIDFDKDKRIVYYGIDFENQGKKVAENVIVKIDIFNYLINEEITKDSELYPKDSPFKKDDAEKRIIPEGIRIRPNESKIFELFYVEKNQIHFLDYQSLSKKNKYLLLNSINYYFKLTIYGDNLDSITEEFIIFVNIKLLNNFLKNNNLKIKDFNSALKIIKVDWTEYSIFMIKFFNFSPLTSFFINAKDIKKKSDKIINKKTKLDLWLFYRNFISSKEVNKGLNLFRKLYRKELSRDKRKETFNEIWRIKNKITKFKKKFSRKLK